MTFHIISPLHLRPLHWLFHLQKHISALRCRSDRSATQTSHPNFENTLLLSSPFHIPYPLMVAAFVRLHRLSASDIKRKWLCGDQAYVVAWVDPEAKKRTILASAVNNTIVQWNEELDLPFSSSTETQESLRSKIITMEIRSKGVFGDPVLATVYVPLVDVPFDGDKEGNSILTYQAFQPWERKQYGSLNFVAKIMKSVKASDSGVDVSNNIVFVGNGGTCSVDVFDPSEEASSAADISVVYPHLDSYLTAHVFYPSLGSPETAKVSSSSNKPVSYPSLYQPNYSQPYMLSNHQEHWQPPPVQTPYYFRPPIHPASL